VACPRMRADWLEFEWSAAVIPHLDAGFVSPDGEGREGLELSLDEELKGKVSEVRGLRDRSGRLIFHEGIEDEAALAGHNIVLTIDKGIQFTAERELEALRTVGFVSPAFARVTAYPIIRF